MYIFLDPLCWSGCIVVNGYDNDVDNDDIESVESDGSNKKKHSIGFYPLHYINSKVFMQTLVVRIQSTFDNVKHVEL